MRRGYDKILRAVMLLGNAALLSAVFNQVWRRVYAPLFKTPFYWRGELLLVALYAAVLLFFYYMLDGQKPGETRLMELDVSQGMGVVLTALVLYVALALMFHGSSTLLPLLAMTGLPLLAMTGLQLVLVILWNGMMDRVYRRLVPPYRMLMVYDRETDPAVALRLCEASDRYDVCGQVHIDAGREAIKALLSEYDAVFIALWDDVWRGWLIRQCLKRNIRMLLRPTVTDIVVSGMRERHPIDTVLLMSSDHRLSLEDRFFKRTLDIIVSAIGIVLASPIMLIAAIAIKLDDRGPVLFRQERLTRNGETFTLLKFRSMVLDAEKNGQRWATKNDERLTRVGRILRMLRIDELPQLFNVLAGEMSLVGPRPETPELTRYFSEELPEFTHRLKVKAGITGYAQVYGNYWTVPADKLLMDVMYIEHYSLMLDICLILLTLRAVLIFEKTSGTDEVVTAKEE